MTKLVLQVSGERRSAVGMPVRDKLYFNSSKLAKNFINVAKYFYGLVEIYDNKKYQKKQLKGLDCWFQY